jgi:hypothetical protein
MSQEGIRAYIKPTTIERYSKYAPVKIGQSVDDFLNDVLTKIEAEKISIQTRGKERSK